MRKSPFPVLIVLVLLALALPSVISLIRGKAQTPDIFSQAYTLEQARELSSQTGKPMFVLATADWCAPCQSLKRGAMVNPEVAQLVSERTIPVYLEDGVNPEQIRDLGVRAYPTTMIIQDGRVMTAIEGAARAGSFVKKLSELPQPAQAAP